MSDTVIVRIEHCRQLQYCSRGVRGLFARYGLDYAKFLESGISSDELLKATDDDAMVAAVVRVAQGNG